MKDDFPYDTTNTWEMNRALFERLGNHVQEGPFKGMWIPEESAWDDSQGMKLIGGYEYELQPTIRKAIERQPYVIANIGAAEGYYAIGIARALPFAWIIVSEIDKKSIELCRLAAKENKVLNRIRFQYSFPLNEVNLMIVDCEGCEKQLLQHHDQLINCDLVVECHDAVEPNITEQIAEKFAATHHVQIIYPVPDYKHKFKLNEKFVVLQDVRPDRVAWLACWASR